MNKPNTSDYNPFFETYIKLVPSGELTSMLVKNNKKTTDFFNKIPEELVEFRYEINKWSIKEVLAHIIDSERVFSYRALVCLRLDGKTELGGMDEKLYAQNRNVSEIAIDELVEEFKVVRKNTLNLYNGVPPENYDFQANSVAGKITANALGHIIIGHTLHHMNIVRERYLSEKH